ncbi:unnamed protein product [Meloidogyne enterolobii]|uniref:Uncharacterized protein n=1 Tax=Meloidogyne enterolobii TaxID=390850 RepID=A0ACB1AV92_MELEN
MFEFTDTSYDHVETQKNLSSFEEIGKNKQNGCISDELLFEKEILCVELKFDR